MTGVAVLCYHGVCPAAEIADPDVEATQLPADAFAAQLDDLARTHELISLDALAALLRGGGPLGAPKAAITIDDGYRNTLTVAEPLLRARGVPFAVFVSTRHMTSGERFPGDVLRMALYLTPRLEACFESVDRTVALTDRAARRAAVAELNPLLKAAPLPVMQRLLDELRALIEPDEWAAIEARLSAGAPLDWDEVRALRDAGATIGSHGHDHALLHERQEPAEVRRQLTESRRAIEVEVGPCPYYAYPNGGRRDIGALAEELAPACGYELAFAAIPGLVRAGAPRALLPRIFAPPTIDTLHARIAAADAA